jgi:hypothetical protein
VEIAEILQSINSFNFRDVEEFLALNRASFIREEQKHKNAACREHIAKHNIKVGDWFNHTYTAKQGYNGSDEVTYMYELQVVKINRTCIKAKGFQISPHSREITYPIDISIMSVIP